MSEKLSQEEKLGEIRRCDAGRDRRTTKYFDIPQTIGSENYHNQV
jgi:hypothetical protein